MNRETNKRWRPDTNEIHQFLIMYDSGYLGVVTDKGWDGFTVCPLDPKVWEKVVK